MIPGRGGWGVGVGGGVGGGGWGVGGVGWGGRGGGVLGQVSDRDAHHRPSTRNATRVKKKGGVETIKLYILPIFYEK